MAEHRWWLIAMPDGGLAIADAGPEINSAHDAEVVAVGVIGHDPDGSRWAQLSDLTIEGSSGARQHRIEDIRAVTIDRLRPYLGDELARADCLQTSMLRTVGAHGAIVVDFDRQLDEATSNADRACSCSMAGRLRELADDPAVDAWRLVLHGAADRLDYYVHDVHHAGGDGGEAGP